MSVLKAWLGVALALAEFAVLPHCEGKVKTAAGVCVPSCSLKHAAAFRVLWVGWKFSDLGGHGVGFPPEISTAGFS